MLVNIIFEVDMKPILPGAPWLIAHKSMLGVNQPKNYFKWERLCYLAKQKR
ncbi:hypothetical protein [Okeania sp. KiyG1]|uniref:hypothetical protein n=1 Tax=Okeania sp. KiyG1 TaxID=2720165 RepID=UPI001F19B4C9|nr:hypothetical protein [Okeania sp. KiyG1]